MRNAVIRKKLIKEQAMIRKFIFAPQRLIVTTAPNVDWMAAANYRQRMLGVWQ